MLKKAYTAKGLSEWPIKKAYQNGVQLFHVSKYNQSTIA